MGRPPKPTALHELEGTLRPDRHGRRKREPRPNGGATAPSWLSPEARREWKRISPELERLGLLTMVDRAALAAYCEAWSRLHAATRAIRAAERVADSVEVARCARRAEQATDKIVRLAAEFGLTPAARAGIEVADPRGEGEKHEPDDIEAFLQRRRLAEQRAAGAQAS
jgi:P27 family predicted phage terminase small subunit